MSKVTPHAMREILNKNIEGAVFRDGEQVVAGEQIANQFAGLVNNPQQDKGRGRE